MNSLPDVRKQLIWATRGRTWGFRFLLDGGLADPLPEYERAFLGLEDATISFRRVDDTVAFRFPDPLGRHDASGRQIPHEFVVLGEVARDMVSVDDGLRLVWPLVADAYSRVWDADSAPAASEI